MSLAAVHESWQQILVCNFAMAQKAHLQIYGRCLQMTSTHLHPNATAWLATLDHHVNILLVQELGHPIRGTANTEPRVWHG